MAKYVSLVKQRLGSFLACKLEHIPRDWNEKEDALVFVAASLPMIETVFLPIYYQLDSLIITTRVRLMSYQPSMVDAQLVHYKVRVRLMSYRPSMVDAQLVHCKARGRLMSYRPSMVDA